jgi:hypothetical protein
VGRGAGGMSGRLMRMVAAFAAAGAVAAFAAAGVGGEVGKPSF